MAHKWVKFCIFLKIPRIHPIYIYMVPTAKSRSDVGQDSDIGHFTDNNFRSQKFKCIILGLWQPIIEK